MPYKRKDSPIWWASFVDASGQRVRRSTGTTDHREACALEAKWKVETYRQKQWEERPSRTFDELMVTYLKATSEKRSHDKDLMRTKHLRRKFQGREVRLIQPNDISAYVVIRKGEGVRPATINRELALFSAAINHANTEWDWQLPNPVKGRKLKEPEGRVRWISRAEAEALIRAAEMEPKAGHLSDFIRLALNTGCRAGELLGLEWKRVDLKAGLIHLEAEHTKTGKRRSVPLNQTARQAIINRARFRAQHCPCSTWVFCDETGVRIASVRRSFTTACRKVGISDFRIHDLRHTCAAWLVSAGVALAEVRDLLGHSTVKMTEKYAHLAPENIRAAVAVLDGGKSRSGHASFSVRSLDCGDEALTA